VSAVVAGAASGLAHDKGARSDPGTQAVSPDGGVLGARLGSDLSVELQQNRPGMLARAAEAIASGGLNIEGFAEVDGTLHLLTGDARTARHALEAAGLRVSGERDVLVVRIEDRFGAAAEVFGRLASAGVNVRHTYVASGHRIVIAADDPAQALAALGA
jgi:hypothetical protein